MLMDLTVVLGCGRSLSTDLAKLIGRIDQSDCSIPTAGLAMTASAALPGPFGLDRAITHDVEATKESTLLLRVTYPEKG